MGTAEYVSPELLVQKVTSTRYHFKNKPSYFSVAQADGKFPDSSDLWAFGCVLFQMISGLPPFRSRSEYLTFQKITQLEYAFPAGFPEDARELISRLLVLEPTARIGASPERGGIEEIKTHPFFAPIEWNRLWELTPPTLEPGLVVARPADNLVHELPAPEFSHGQTSPPIPPSCQLSPDIHPVPTSPVDHEEHLTPYPDPQEVDDIGSARSGIANTLSKRKSWLLRAGRRKSKDGLDPLSSGGEMTW